MPITQVVPHEGGGAWGWDSDAGQWVPVDQQMLQGSLPGNLLRAGGRGLQDIGLGINQLAEPNAPDVQARIKILDLQKEAASRAAPWTEAIGEGLPDVAAGLATVPFTGGMSLPATLGLAGVGGALSGGIRTGSLEDRVTNALIGAAAGVAGAGLGEAAIRGVGAGLRVAETITTRNAASVARGVEVGGQRVQNAADRARLAQAAEAEGGAAAEGGTAMPGAPGEAADAGIQPGQSTAGAARNPNAPPDPYAAMESAGASGEVSTAASDAQRLRVEDMGYRSPSHADTRTGSIPRWLSGVNETTPWGQISVAADKAANQKLAANTVGEAMGLPDRVTLQSHDVAEAAETIGARFNRMATDIPDINRGEYAGVLKNLQSEPGAFSGGKGQKLIDRAITNAEDQADGAYSGRQIMNDRTRIADAMSKFYANSQSGEGDLMRQALEKIDDLIARKAAEKGDTQLAQRWAQAREQWQVYSMVKRPGAISQAGDVNPRSLMSMMKADRSRGGFSHGGPRNQGPARRAFDLLDVMNRDESGIPMTGVRTAGVLANLGLHTAGTAAFGVPAMGVLNSLLGGR